MKIGDLVTLDIPNCTSPYAEPKGVPAIVAKVVTNAWGRTLEVMTPQGPRTWLQREVKVINESR